MNSIAPQLWQAYHDTTFQTKSPAIKIRICERSPELDELLRQNNVNEWAFITASNPGPQSLSDDENQKRHRQLEEDVRAMNLPSYQGEGVGTDPAYKPEVSLLILGITLVEAVELGRKYGQYAIVHGQVGKKAVLFPC